MTVSERIRGERHRYGLTQKELAALIGVDTKTVIRWEAGRSRPTDSHLLRLVRVLDLPLDDGDLDVAGAPTPRRSRLRDLKPRRSP